MGYTHYWDYKQASHASLRLAADDMIKILAAEWIVPLIGDAFGETPVPTIVSNEKKVEIVFNGLGVNGHETFSFPPTEGFNFCKTARKPYDGVVTACLVAAADRLGVNLTVTSDGGAEGLSAGCQLAARVLGRPLVNPISGDTVGGPSGQEDLSDGTI